MRAERPAAVVKELVENALDAGATRIEVEFRHGGRSLMRIEDNGAGMSRDDALLALERHATSKIAVADDLDRAHLKVLRLAGLAACMSNPSKPQVTEVHAKWAIEFVEVDMAYISSRFERGDVGEGDAKQMNVLREKLRSFFNTSKPPTKDPKWLEMLAKGAIPHSLVSQKLLAVACFANDRRGATSALNACLKELITMGEVREIPIQQVSQEFGKSCKAYLLVEG